MAELENEEDRGRCTEDKTLRRNLRASDGSFRKVPDLLNLGSDCDFMASISLSIRPAIIMAFREICKHLFLHGLNPTGLKQLRSCCRQLPKDFRFIWAG